MLPRDFYERNEVAVVILELLDEVCYRLRRAKQYLMTYPSEKGYIRLWIAFMIDSEKPASCEP